MAKENIEDLSTKILRRRRRFVLGLNITFIVIMMFNLVLIGMSITDQERELQFIYFFPFLAYLGIILPMNMGVKKINGELAKRNKK